LEEHPEVFEYCKWTDCEANSPLKEYSLWIPSFNSPLSIFKTSVKGNKCFSSLFHHKHYDWEKPIDYGFILTNKGYTIKLYGFSEETQQNN